MQALSINKAGVVLIGTRRGGRVDEEKLGGAALAPHIGKRARKGRAPESKMKLDGMRPVLAAYTSSTGGSEQGRGEQSQASSTCRRDTKARAVRRQNPGCSVVAA